MEVGSTFNFLFDSEQREKWITNEYAPAHQRQQYVIFLMLLFIYRETRKEKMLSMFVLELELNFFYSIMELLQMYQMAMVCAYLT